MGAEALYTAMMGQYRDNYIKVLAHLRSMPSSHVTAEAIYICKSRNGFID